MENIDILWANIFRMSGLYDAVWTFGATYLVLRMVNEVHKLRVTREEEVVGLNISEHGLVAGEHAPLMDV